MLVLHKTRGKNVFSSCILSDSITERQHSERKWSHSQRAVVAGRENIGKEIMGSLVTLLQGTPPRVWPMPGHVESGIIEYHGWVWKLLGPNSSATFSRSGKPDLILELLEN